MPAQAMMQRVLVVGSGGAGKTTFARRLGEITALPVIHLDALHWRPGWVEPPRDEWRRTVERLAAEDRWIMDGNFGGTIEPRLAACDTFIMLDLPRTTCLRRVVQRRLRHLGGRTRPDMAPGCPEQVNAAFVSWIWNYPAKSKPRILSKLQALRPDLTPVVLRSDQEIEGFLASARTSLVR